MKRLLVSLALAALVAAGCRAVAPRAGCGQPVGCSDGVSCASACAAPCPPNFAGAAGCPEDCGVFPRYCGPACDDGRVYGPYDCAPCNGPPCYNACGYAGPGPGISSGDQRYNFNPGPPVGQTAYPYYTVRGPRDFLLDNPPPLGPY